MVHIVGGPSSSGGFEERKLILPPSVSNDAALQESPSVPRSEIEAARRFWEHIKDTARSSSKLFNSIKEIATENIIPIPRGAGTYALPVVLYALSLNPRGREYLEYVVPQIVEIKEIEPEQVIVEVGRLNPNGERVLPFTEMDNPYDLCAAVEKLSYSGFLYWFADSISAEGPHNSERINEFGESLIADAKRKELKILTYNVWGTPHLWGGTAHDRFAEIAKSLKKSDFDIVSIQEMWSRNTGPIVHESGFDYKAHAPNMHGFMGSNGLLTLSRYPIIKQETLVFDDKVGVERLVKKGALFTRIQLDDSSFRDIYNLHLNSSGEGISAWFGGYKNADEIRQRQIAQLRAWINERKVPGIPVFVMGDFNVHETEAPYPKMTTAFGVDIYRTLFKPGAAVEHLPENLRDAHKGFTFDSDKNHWAMIKNEPAARYDYIFAEGLPETNLALETSREFLDPSHKGKPLSDHYGVSSTIIDLS